MAEPVTPAARSPYKLLALDVDGTLVGPGLEITPRNLASLRAAVTAGVHVVLATGRMFRSALPYVRQIGASEPVICYQGAVVRSAGGQVLREWPVDPESASAAVRFSRAHDVHINLYQDDNFYIEKDSWGARRYAEVAQIDPIMVPDLMDLAGGGSTKIVYVDQPQRLRALEPDLRQAIEPACRATFSLPEFLEVVASDVSKARALEFVCRRLGVDRSEVLAAGDAQNDTEMFAYAALAVAPRTADRSALDLAQAVVASPDEDGIAELVERFLQV